MGISRSASIVIAYLMKRDNLSYNEVFEIVKAKRDIIDPNLQFSEYLAGRTPREQTDRDEASVWGGIALIFFKFKHDGLGLIKRPHINGRRRSTL